MEKTKRKAAPTLKDLLDEFWEVELAKTPTGKERKRIVEKDALPKWSNKRVSDITRRDAVLLLDKARVYFAKRLQRKNVSVVGAKLRCGIDIFTGAGTDGAWDRIDYPALFSENGLAQDVVYNRLFLAVKFIRV